MILTFILLKHTDGIVGEVLFWTLRKCLGIKYYSEECHIAWVKVFSRMLRTMIPVVIANEIKTGSASQLERQKKLQAMSGALMTRGDDGTEETTQVGGGNSTSVSANSKVLKLKK